MRHEPFTHIQTWPIHTYKTWRIPTYETRPIHKWQMTRMMWSIRTYKTRTIHTYYCVLRDGRWVYTTHAYVWQDSSMCARWLHSYVRRESLMFDMAHCAGRWRYKTLSCMSRDSFTFVTWLIAYYRLDVHVTNVTWIVTWIDSCHKCETLRTLGWSVKVSSELTKPTSFTTFLTRFKSPPHASFTWKSKCKWEYVKMHMTICIHIYMYGHTCICMHGSFARQQKWTWEYI